ncbi:DUF5707 domain-containing protein [Streptomyces sp. NPDC097727]|uniref:DUF5707 domain-containing protein n=1 Tax=Streptomyces sp. NPDC097727 TaxID=3366092 RepID=UPI0038227911
MVVNGGKDIVLGATDVKTFTIAVTATDDSGIEVGRIFPVMWHTPLPNGDYYGLVIPDNIAGKCVRQSFTTTTCTYTLKMNPRIHPQDNTTAGTWTVSAHALANDGDYITKDSAGKAKVLRSSKLTVNASPESGEEEQDDHRHRRPDPRRSIPSRTSFSPYDLRSPTAETAVGDE